MIQTVGIIGAGTMGNGIAQVCAAAGLSVVMVDISDAAVNRGKPVLGRSTVLHPRGTCPRRATTRQRCWAMPGPSR